MNRICFAALVAHLLFLCAAVEAEHLNELGGPLHPFLSGTESHLKFEHQPLLGIVPSVLSELEQSLRRPAGASLAWESEGYNLAVNPSEQLGVCEEGPARVKVTVTSSTPSTTHWVAAYSPANANISEIAPVKYVVVSEAQPEYLQSGAATLTLDLTCMRADYSLVLFSADPPNGWWIDQQVDPAAAVAVARSTSLSFSDPDAPTKARVTPFGPRLNSGGDYSGSVRVQWSSGRGPEHSPTLHWAPGTSNSVSFTHVPASSYTYSRGDLCGAPANQWGYRDIGWVHQAEIPHPTPGSSLQYYMSDSSGARSRTYTLRVPPTPGPQVRTRLALFGDMGRGTSDDSKVWHPYGYAALNVSRQLGAEAQNGEIDAVFCFGDLSYAMGFSSQWDEWLGQVEQFAAVVPFLTNLGNHEYGGSLSAWEASSNLPPSLFSTNDSGGECGVPALSLFSTPGASDGRGALWWAQSVGTVALISMCTEVDFSQGSEQWLFLEQALASVDRSVTPWVIFAGHRPGLVDSSYDNCDGCTKTKGGMDPADGAVMRQIQSHLGPLFDRFQVDIALWGHNHAYQRQCAFNTESGECVQHSQRYNPAKYSNPTGTIHLVVGSAGANFSNNQNHADFNDEEFYKYGYFKLTADNSTHLYGEFIEASQGPEGATSYDSFVLEKEQYDTKIEGIDNVMNRVWTSEFA